MQLHVYSQCEDGFSPIKITKLCILLAGLINDTDNVPELSKCSWNGSELLNVKL